MRKYVTEKVSHLSIKLLISYLSILIAPFCAIVLIYFASRDLLLSVQKEKMNTTLNTTALEVTRGFVEAGNLESYISNMNELKSLSMKIQKGKAKYYDMFLFSKDLPDYSAINSVIGDVYLFFRNGNWVMKNKSVVPATNEAYSSLGTFNEITYEELAEQFNNSYYNKSFLEYPGHQNNHTMLVAHSFPFDNFRSGEGTIVISINESLILEKLRNNLIQEEGIVLVTNREGYLYQSMIGVKTQEKAENLPIQKLLACKEDNIRVNGKNYTISKVEEALFTYVVLIPKSIVLRQVGYMKYIIIALCVISIFIGFLTCIALWRKRRQVVVAFDDYQGRFGKAEGDKKARMGFCEGIPFVLESVANLQTTILMQRNFMKSAVIRKMILGGYHSEDEIENDMKNAEISLSGTLYDTAVIMMNHNSMNLDYGNWNEINLSMSDYIKKKLTFPHQFCNIDYYTFALIFPVTRENMRPVILDILTEIENDLANNLHIETYIGIGKEVGTRLEIAAAFEDAVEVCEYLRYHDISMPLSKEEMPKNTETFFFPVETELHLLKTIKQGNVVELKNLFQVLTYENFTYRDLPLLMVNYLMELVRGTVIRALREEEYDYQIILEELTHANTLEVIEQVIMKVMPCIQEKQKLKESKEAEEKKEQIRSLIEEYYADADLNLAQIAERYKVPENKLYKEFKGLFGISFSEYVENERIKKACELLQQKQPIKDVAEAVGYRSDISFRRAFKRVMGLPPSYYADGLSKS